MPGWALLDGGATLGQRGSEDGVIVLDEEYGGAARITIEHVEARGWWSITCGVYGWMVHTRFTGSEAAARADCAAMKQGLERIRALAEASDAADRAAVVAAVEAFVDAWT